MNNKLKGLIFGVIASIAYGTNPLFSLPLYAEKMTPDSVLFYRYIFATIILGGCLLIKGESLRIKKHEVLPLFGLGVFFSLSSLFLFQSFLFMDAGIASTILFVYPILVAVIMTLFFKEKASILTFGCIALSIVGISLLYKGDGETALSTKGLLLVALSALTYSVYIIGVGHPSLRNISIGRMTFWVIAFGSIVYVVRTGFMTELQAVPSSLNGWFNVIGVAIVPTVISILFINIAVKYIGSTTTAVIGALEPVTALLIGVLIFHEQITSRIIWGVFLILIAVTLVVAGKPILSDIVKRAHSIHHRFRKSL